MDEIPEKSWRELSEGFIIERSDQRTNGSTFPDTSYKSGAVALFVSSLKPPSSIP